MARLAHAPVPLLVAEPAGSRVEQRTRVQLTDTGRAVLDGAEDHVALNGVDRWIGGVHVRGRDLRWRWNEGTESVTPAS